MYLAMSIVPCRQHFKSYVSHFTRFVHMTFGIDFDMDTVSVDRLTGRMTIIVC